MARILIVDDEPMISLLLSEWIAELGHETIGPASTVANALSLIEASRPDGAIVDITLGDEDAYPIAVQLRNNSIPFIFASGHGSGALLGEFKATPVLGKPFDFKMLKSALSQIFSP